MYLPVLRLQGKANLGALCFNVERNKQLISQSMSMLFSVTNHKTFIYSSISTKRKNFKFLNLQYIVYNLMSSNLPKKFEFLNTVYCYKLEIKKVVIKMCKKGYKELLSQVTYILLSLTCRVRSQRRHRTHGI